MLRDQASWYCIRHVRSRPIGTSKMLSHVWWKNVSTFKFYRALFNTITLGAKTGKSLATKQCFSPFGRGSKLPWLKSKHPGNNRVYEINYLCTWTLVPTCQCHLQFIFFFCTNVWVFILFYFYLDLNLGALPRMGRTYPFWVYFFSFLCVCLLYYKFIYTYIARGVPNKASKKKKKK